MVRPLSVLQLVPTLIGGGVERGTLEVAQALVDAGHRSVVVSGGGRLVPELTAAGSEHICWPIWRKSLFSLRFVPRLRQLLNARQFDIVHARSRVPAWIAWLAWRGMDADRRPHFVTTVHGLYSVNAYSRIMTRGERVIAVSQTVRDYIGHNYPDVESARIELIPRGVAPADFPYGLQPSAQWMAHWQQQFPQLRGKQVLTLPGRITRLKGHHDLLALIQALKRRGLRPHGLVVGGEDPHRLAYARELVQRVEQMDLTADISFIGHRSDVREIYAISDLVLSLSSRPESFGRTVLEALSLGRPVVGYDHGGVGEVLAAVYPSGRVPLGDVDALTERVVTLLRQPVPVPPAQPFTLDAMLQATLSLYRGLV